MHEITEKDLREGKLILIDKPLGWTSFDVVNKIRGTLRKKFKRKRIKVGHGGTLDPLATGLLVIGIGPATKRLGEIQADKKTYEGTMFFGAETPSYDAETEPTKHYDKPFPLRSVLHKTARAMEGSYEQYPPLYSAVKVQGKKLYEYAREGQEEVKIKPRKVHIYRFELTRISPPYIDFVTEVSKGTYIRSLVHDFGKKLDNGAYLTALRRTASGNFTVDQAVSLEEWLKFNEKS